MRFILILTLAIVLVNSDQLIPILKGGYGFSIGDQYGKLQIEAFFDFQCPDSKDSFNVLRNVIKTVDFKRIGVKLTFQMIPLQFHHYAYKLHNAFYHVQLNSDKDTTYKLIEYFFDQQSSFTEEVLLDYTLDNFLNQLARIVSAVTKVNEKSLRDSLTVTSPTDYGTRNHWKYSIGTHGVSGAPIFNANGVRIDGAENWGYDQWTSFIEKYTN